MKEVACIFLFLIAVARLIAVPGDIIWSYATGGEIKSSVAIDRDGCLYFGVNDPLADDPAADNRILALNADGSLKWEYPMTDWVEASPALSGDGSTLYIGGWDGSIYALNCADGSLKWQWEGAGVIIASVAIGKDGVVYCSDGDQALVALDPETGEALWSTSILLVRDWVDSSPAISEGGMIYFGSWDGKLYEVDADGKSSGWVGATNNVVVSSPCIGEDGTVYIGSEDGYVYAFTPGIAAPKWMFETQGSINGSPVIGVDGSVLVGSGDGFLYCLNAQNGSANWSFPVGDVVFSTPAVDSAGNVYFGCGDQYLYALDVNGNFLWELYTGGWVDASPAIGEDGTIYVGSYDGNLYALEGSGELAWGIWPRFRADNAGIGRSDAYRLWAKREKLIDPSPLADTDEDGLANLWEFALGLDTEQRDSRHLMQASVNQNGEASTWTWWWHDGVAGVAVEASSDLKTWREVYPQPETEFSWVVMVSELSDDAWMGLSLDTVNAEMDGWFIRLQLTE